MIFNLQRQKFLGYAFKVNFAKSFDSLDYNFLLEILAAWGFGPLWISYIHNILSSAKAKVLVNGEPHGYMRYKWGLRQGGPLSPMFFALAADALSAMFTHTLCSSVLIGVTLDPLEKICHL